MRVKEREREREPIKLIDNYQYMYVLSLYNRMKSNIDWRFKLFGDGTANDQILIFLVSRNLSEIIRKRDEKISNNLLIMNYYGIQYYTIFLESKKLFIKL